MPQGVSSYLKGPATSLKDGTGRVRQRERVRERDRERGEALICVMEERMEIKGKRALRDNGHFLSSFDLLVSSGSSEVKVVCLPSPKVAKDPL